MNRPLLAIFLVAAARFGASVSAQTVADPDLLVKTVVAGLDQPTHLAFIGPGELLVSEKATGRVLWVKGGVVKSVALDLPVNADGYRGLLSIAVHPNFSQNGWVYVFYSRAASDGGAWIENRVSRFRWTGRGLSPASEEPIVTFPADDDQNNEPICAGGVVRFGPDGKLYGATGDMSRGDFDNGRIEQNTGGAAAGVGGIYRLEDDGSIPADNPFADHASDEIARLFAYGMRDCFGMTFDSRGRLWATENGPEVFDEINLIGSGFNSGWLKLMGPDSRDAAFTRNLFTAFDETDLVKLPGAYYEDPRFSFLSPIGITAIVALDSPRYPARVRGGLIVGDTNFGELYFFRPDATAGGKQFVLNGDLRDTVADSDAERSAVSFGSGWGVTTDLKVGPDGLLYHVSLTDGAVRMIAPRETPPHSERAMPAKSIP